MVLQEGKGKATFYPKEIEFTGEVFYQSNEQAGFSKYWGLVWILNVHQINTWRKHKCSEILRLEACFLWLSVLCIFILKYEERSILFYFSVS